MNTRHAVMGRVAMPPFAAASGARWAATYLPHRFDLMNKRRVYQTRSHDFLHWSEPLPIAQPDDLWDDLDDMHYGMAQFRVGRQQFGTLGIFQHADDRMHVRLMHSRDGVRWGPTNRANPFLAPRGEGAWDAHMVSIVSPPIVMGDELWFYHGGTTGHHDYWMSGREHLDHPEAHDPFQHVRFAMGLARLRRDGFCSLDTGDVRPGAVATRPVRSGGTKLSVNARCREGGSVRVELTDHNGNVLPGCDLDACDPFQGDAVDHVVTWNGNSRATGEGDFRRVVIHLRRAELFSFRFV